MKVPSLGSYAFTVPINDKLIKKILALKGLVVNSPFFNWRSIRLTQKECQRALTTMHTRLRTRNCKNEEKFLPDVLKEACRVARKVICFETEDNSSLNSEYIISGRHLDRLGG